MTVSTETGRVEYTGNGTTTEFAVPFEFQDDTDIDVYVSGTLKTLTTHYTVDGGDGSTGSVTFVTAPAAATDVVIVDHPPITQATDYTENDDFPAESHERALDKLTRLVRRMDTRIDRAIHLADSEAGVDSTELPPPDALKLIGWDADGTGLANYSADSISADVTVIDWVSDTYDGDGSTVNFTLSRDPGVAANCDVSVSGVSQRPGTDYTVSGTTLTFTTAPPIGTDNICARYGSSLGAYTASAENVSYLPAGTGAVETDVRTKLREVVSVKDFGATGDGSTDDAGAIEAADAYADTNRVPVFFPPGSYRVKRTITRVSQSAWFGPAQQSNANLNNEVQIYGTVGDIGDGNPMIRCAATGVTTSVSSLSFENLEFISDKSVDFSNLSATTSNGITLVDVSNVKNGLEFNGCAFKNAAYGIRQSDGDPYLDKVTLDRCHFTLLYKAIQCNPTSGLSLANCFVYDCFDWIYTKGIAGTRANGAEVFLNACSFNNSSFAAEYTSITASAIVAIGCWFEGGNHWLHATKYAKAEGCYFSEAYSAISSTKFSMAPNDPDVNSCAFVSIGNRIATNTRLIDLGSVTDKTTISVTCIANYNGSNFSDVAAIATQLTNGIDYEGYANINTSAWNVSQHNRKMAIGTKRNPEHQVDVQNSGGGAGVFQRITDTASSLPMAGFIFERSQSGSNDFRAAANTVGEFEVASSTDGVSWTARARVGTSWQWEPGADNTQKLGSASFRWSEVFAGNGTINTSDANLKQQIRDIYGAEKAVALAIKGKIKAYKFNDAVQAKGDAARIHFGVIAQDIAEAFAMHGLDAEHYGVFCKDTVWTKDGHPVSQDEFSNYPAGSESHERLGVRYDELFAFIIGSI